MLSKSCLLVCCLLVAVIADDKYTDKYDNLDIQEVIENDRLFNGYISCIFDEGPCTPPGLELKSHIQEALENGCKKCTETQLDKGTTLFDYVINKKRTVWKRLTDKFDPTGEYRKKYEEDAKKRGIVIPNDE